MKYINLLVFSTSFVVAFLISALILQFFYEPPPIISGWRSSAPDNELNQFGFRGQSIHYSDDEFIVVLVGDSQVEAITGCTFETMPEKRLEYHLNTILKRRKCKVFSLGASGYGQDQELLVLKEYFSKYKADLVIHWFTPGNDIWNNIFPTHMPKNGRPKPTFRLDKEELIGPSENMGDEIETSNIKIVTMFKRLCMDRDGKWEQYLPEAYQPLSEFQGPVSYDWQIKFDNNSGLMRSENLDNEKTHMSLLLYPPSKRLAYGLELTKRLIRDMEVLTLNNGGDFIVFSIDNAGPAVNKKLILGKKILKRKIKQKRKRKNDVEVQFLNRKYYQTSLKQFWRNIKYISKDFNYYCIPPKIKNWRVSDTDGHLNEKATDQVMHDLAIAIKPRIESLLNGKYRVR